MGINLVRALLFSGGLDSSALACWIKPDVAITVDYGQVPAGGEIKAASALSKLLKMRHEVVRLDLGRFGIGSLANRTPSTLGRSVEWWPYRNQMLITIAGMYLLPQGLSEIVIGTVSSDEHADGSARFINTIDRLMSLQEGNVHVVAPAQKLTSKKLLEVSKFPRDLLGLTFSCHTDEFPCGVCRGCAKHFSVLRELNK